MKFGVKSKGHKTKTAVECTIRIVLCCGKLEPSPAVRMPDGTWKFEIHVTPYHDGERTTVPLGARVAVMFLVSWNSLGIPVVFQLLQHVRGKRAGNKGPRSELGGRSPCQIRFFLCHVRIIIIFSLLLLLCVGD